jgi:phosphatidylserine/phosphatidylglycerophosphate/cardiolipin synthase-like enzyme
MSRPFRRRSGALLALAIAAACRSAPLPASRSAFRIELAETAPVETSLDRPELRSADEVWLEAFRGAERAIDLAHFYAVSAPGSRLEPVIAELERAAGRGVRVRMLLDARFRGNDPATLARLAAIPGLEVARLDLGPTTGGVLHAKYFVVDGCIAFLGSQNFDWRSLEHIQELGVLVDSPPIAAGLSAIFGRDWAAAIGAPDPARRFAGTAEDVLAARGGTVRARIVASPLGELPAGIDWDLPALVELIDGASASVRVQLLTYRASDRDGSPFTELEDALLRAAARGVRVQLLLSDWCQRAGTIEGLQELARRAPIAIRLVTLPSASTGFIPYARTIHAKYLTVDGERAWIGTSNWEGDYFHASRNVGLVLEGRATARELEAVFEALWTSGYAADLDPQRAYEPPRISAAPW